MILVVGISAAYVRYKRSSTQNQAPPSSSREFPKVGDIHTPTRKPRSPRHIDYPRQNSSQQDTRRHQPQVNQTQRPGPISTEFCSTLGRKEERHRGQEEGGENKENIVSEDKGVCECVYTRTLHTSPIFPRLDEKAFPSRRWPDDSLSSRPGSRQTLKVGRHMHG